VPIYFKAKLITVDCAITDAASLGNFDDTDAISYF